MHKARLRDLVIVLPGITGSILAKDGKPIWAPSWTILSRTLLTSGRALDSLMLTDDDPQADDLGDGVQVAGLVETAHLVPGLVKIDGYTDLCRMVTDTFEVVRGDITSAGPANFVPFPYDWRRDLRASARRLGRFVERALPTWREYSGAQDAKVVILAHSMGGLIARYWIEVLGGVRDCRALITMGTPHRGSIQTLDFLVNGYRKLVVDLTDVMRSCTSVHQLLPIYPCVSGGGAWRRATELTGLPGLDQERAVAGLAFHREIENAVSARLGGTGGGQTDGGQTDGESYALVPIVGTTQPTTQSAKVTDTGLFFDRTPPTDLDMDLADGDGTVPRVSAIPIELSSSVRETLVPERHSSLHNSRYVLTELRGKLLHLQARGLSAIRGPRGPQEPQGSRNAPPPQPPGIELDLPDATPVGEPLPVRARPVGAADAGALTATVQPVHGPGDPVRVVLTNDGWSWTSSLDGLTPGVHRLTVTADYQGPGAPHPVHDLFEVVAP